MDAEWVGRYGVSFMSISGDWSTLAAKLQNTIFCACSCAHNLVKHPCKCVQKLNSWPHWWVDCCCGLHKITRFSTLTARMRLQCMCITMQNIWAMVLPTSFLLSMFSNAYVVSTYVYLSHWNCIRRPAISTSLRSVSARTLYFVFFFYWREHKFVLFYGIVLKVMWMKQIK